LDGKSYENFEEMIENDDIEVIVVATPSHLHSSYTIQALRKGKNVICEKPMATNLEEADKMIEVAKEEGKNYARKLGADLVGIASAERFKNAPLKMSPEGLMPEAKSVIVVAIHHLDCATTMTSISSFSIISSKFS